MSKIITLVKATIRVGLINAFKLFFAHYSKKVFALRGSFSRAPFYIRGKESDIDVFKHIFVDNEYYVFSTLKNYRPTVIVDAGANIGSSSVFFAEKYPGAKIIAIEPDESNCKMFSRNTYHIKHIHLIQGGLWNKSCKLYFDEDPGRKFSVTVNEQAVSENSINAITVDEIMKEHDLKHINILKIDIEGAEKELFSENFGTWIDKVEFFLIELHDRKKAGCTKAFFQAISRLDYAYTYTGGECLLIKNNQFKTTEH